MIYCLDVAGTRFEVRVDSAADGWQVVVDGQPLAADIRAVDGRTISILAGARSLCATIEAVPEPSRSSAQSPTKFEVRVAGRTLPVSLAVPVPRSFDAPRRRGRREALEQAGRVPVTAPMAGRVARLLAAPGEAVRAGQGLVVLEAMKMQNEVRSPKNGRLAALAAREGATVAAGELLAEVE